MARDHDEVQTSVALDDEAPLRLDAYTADGTYIGRISRYLDEVVDDTAGTEHDPVDVLDTHGKNLGERRVVIDGQGTTLQAEVIVPVETLDIDLRGRRATLPFTMQQLRDTPHYDPLDREAPPLNR